MKKLISIITLALVLVSAAGCSTTDAVANISDKDTALVTIGDEEITKGDVYTYMNNQDLSSMVIEDCDSVIYDKYVTLSQDKLDEIDEQIDETIVQYGGEDTFVSTLQAYGFADLDDYRNNLINSAKADELTVMYVTNNLDTYTTKYQPKMIQYMEFDNIDDANNAQDLLANGASFSDVATEIVYTDPIEPVIATIYSTDIASTIIQTIAEVNETGLLSTVITDDTNSLYYVVNVTDVDVANFQDSFVSFLTTQSDIAKEAKISYYDEMGFAIYDINLYNSFLSSNADYLVQDAE